MRKEGNAQPMFRVAVIAGVGLIGGSLALGLRQRGLAEHVIGYDASPEALQEALALGVIDEARASSGEWLRGAIIASAPHIALLSRQRMSGLTHQAMSRSEQVAYSVGDDTRLFVVTAEGNWFDAQLPLVIAAPATRLTSSPWQVVLFVAQNSESA